MPSYLLFLVVAVAAIRITRSFIPIHQRNKRAASATIRSSFILKAQLSLQTIEIARQINPGDYERLLRATIPASDNIIRWYIAKFTNDSAIIEAVVEKES